MTSSTEIVLWLCGVGLSGLGTSIAFRDYLTRSGAHLILDLVAVLSGYLLAYSALFEGDWWVVRLGSSAYCLALGLLGFAAIAIAALSRAGQDQLTSDKCQRHRDVYRPTGLLIRWPVYRSNGTR